MTDIERDPGGVSLPEKRTNSNLHSNSTCACPCVKMLVCAADLYFHTWASTSTIAM